MGLSQQESQARLAQAAQEHAQQMQLAQAKLAQDAQQTQVAMQLQQQTHAQQAAMDQQRMAITQQYHQMMVKQQQDKLAETAKMNQAKLTAQSKDIADSYAARQNFEIDKKAFMAAGDDERTATIKAGLKNSQGLKIPGHTLGTMMAELPRPKVEPPTKVIDGVTLYQQPNGKWDQIHKAAAPGSGKADPYDNEQLKFYYRQIAEADKVLQLAPENAEAKAQIKEAKEGINDLNRARNRPDAFIDGVNLLPKEQRGQTQTPEGVQVIKRDADGKIRLPPTEREKERATIDQNQKVMDYLDSIAARNAAKTAAAAAPQQAQESHPTATPQSKPMWNSPTDLLKYYRSGRMSKSEAKAIIKENWPDENLDIQGPEWDTSNLDTKVRKSWSLEMVPDASGNMTHTTSATSPYE